MFVSDRKFYFRIHDERKKNEFEIALGNEQWRDCKPALIKIIILLKKIKTIFIFQLETRV